MFSERVGPRQFLRTGSEPLAEVDEVTLNGKAMELNEIKDLPVSYQLS
jgi:hypothetical protein